MGKGSFISFLTPPFPYFIEGNITNYKKGQRHPKRSNFGYFDVIIVKKGVLYIGEENSRWDLRPGDVLILEPDKLHYPVSPCLEDTQFYWFHFHTSDKWFVQNKDDNLVSNDVLTKAHFHAEHQTIQLAKHQKLINPKDVFTMLDLLFESALKTRSLAIWETQQAFMKVLQSLEYDYNNHSSSFLLAERIEIYLKKIINYRSRMKN